MQCRPSVLYLKILFCAVSIFPCASVKERIVVQIKVYEGTVECFCPLRLYSLRFFSVHDLNYSILFRGIRVQQSVLQENQISQRSFNVPPKQRTLQRDVQQVSLTFVYIQYTLMQIRQLRCSHFID